VTHSTSVTVCNLYPLSAVSKRRLFSFLAGAKLEGRDGLHIQKVQEAVVAPDEVDDEDLGQARLDLHLRERGRRRRRFIRGALKRLLRPIQILRHFRLRQSFAVGERQNHTLNNLPLRSK